MKRRVRRTLLVLALGMLFLASSGPAEETGPRLKVVTFNIWGIVGAKQRSLRAEAIGRKLAELNPDIIALEEVFESPQRDVVLAGLAKEGYEVRDWKYFRHLYGSGLLFVSRFPIVEFLFEPYRVNCCFKDLERLGGKGIAYLRLETPQGPLDFFHTHALSRSTPIFDEAGEFIPGDPKQIHRLLQMYQVDRFVRAHKKPDSRALIAAGDFNVSPEMLEYAFLASLTGFENSFDLLHPGGNPSTFSKENLWTKGEEFSRIDHIFFKNFAAGSGFWLKPVEAEVIMTETFTTPKTMRPVNYSDHYGLLTEFEMTTAEGINPSPAGIVPQPCPCNLCPLDGYTAGRLELTTQNLQRWRNFALLIFREAYDHRDAENPLLLPLAEIIAKTPGDEPIKILFEPTAQTLLQKKIKELCGENQVPPPEEKTGEEKETEKKDSEESPPASPETKEKNKGPSENVAG